MKSVAIVTVAIVLVVAATVQGFTPASRQLVQGGRPATTTQLQKSIFDAISDMDLWAPDKDANTYGARKKKKVRIHCRIYIYIYIEQVVVDFFETNKHVVLYVHQTQMMLPLLIYSLDFVWN